MHPLLTDRLVEVVTDPRTVLTLLIWLWRPGVVLAFAGIVVMVWLLILLGRSEGPTPSPRDEEGRGAR